MVCVAPVTETVLTDVRKTDNNKQNEEHTDSSKRDILMLFSTLNPPKASKPFMPVCKQCSPCLTSIVLANSFVFGHVTQHSCTSVQMVCTSVRLGCEAAGITVMAVNHMCGGPAPSSCVLGVCAGRGGALMLPHCDTQTKHDIFPPMYKCTHLA